MTVAALMAALMVVSALPVLADPPPNKPGQYTCYAVDYSTNSFEIVDTSVPQGQVAKYTFGDQTGQSGPFGYCIPNQ